MGKFEHGEFSDDVVAVTYLNLIRFTQLKSFILML